MAFLLLTGASRGIGLALAKDLAKDGAHLLLTARDPKGLETAAEAVRQAGGQATLVPADIATVEGRRAILEAAAKIGPLDAAILNAGVEVAVAFADQSPAQIQQQLEVNLSAPLALCREILPGMLQRKKGSVVFISSMSGKSPTPYNSVYAATKHALVGFVSSLRIELEGSGVHAGVVCPSFVADAGMWADTGVKAPVAMREVPLPKVLAAVRAAMDGAGEVLVTPGPIRPLLALAQLFPSLQSRVLRSIGVMDVLQQRAAVVKKH